MSYDLFPLDDHRHHHHSPSDDMISLEDVPSLLEAGIFSAPPDVSLNSIFPEEPNPNPNPNPDSPANLTPITENTETQSPRSESQTPPPTHVPNLPNLPDFSNGFVGVRTELPLYFAGGYSSGCGMPWLCFQPSYGTFAGSPAFLGSEGSFMFDQFGRTYGTGGIQGDGFSRLTEVDEESTKTPRYSAEERKEKIEKYRAKRCLRNFSKTIKYICRKTVAESMPRIQGRFASTDGARGTPM